jgi:hypothetical protein
MFLCLFGRLLRVRAEDRRKSITCTFDILPRLTNADKYDQDVRELLSISFVCYYACCKKLDTRHADAGPKNHLETEVWLCIALPTSDHCLLILPTISLFPVVFSFPSPSYYHHVTTNLSCSLQAKPLLETNHTYSTFTSPLHHREPHVELYIASHRPSCLHHTRYGCFPAITDRKEGRRGRRCAVRSTSQSCEGVVGIT